VSGHTTDAGSESDTAASTPGLGRAGRVAGDGDDTRGVVVDASAKINLYLEVLGRREDGYHEIDTVMQTIDLADTIALRAWDDNEFTLSVAGRSEGVPSDDANLVMRAAAALVTEVRSCGEDPPRAGADIEIIKRIPPGAGLGGGSSDAAATLVGLQRLWNTDVPGKLLQEVAAHLGSDVPFFVEGGTARCRGRGEILEPLVAEGAIHAVVVFGEPLDTAHVYDVFSRMALTYMHATDTLFWCEGKTVRLGELRSTMLRNDLEGAAFQIRPELQEVKELLVKAGANQACMSGSGSCVFGVVESKAHAGRVASEVEDAGHECVVVESVGPRCRGGGKHGSH